ncbi:MAG TPA: GNAT family N-acetyltransferase [Candidatus Saccharimonadales bacterium]|nr:GNAT family N-acetyltransferase [Candidatus Saccharimonadales bacterium]
MHGPRLVGTNGTELRPPTQEDAKRIAHWMLDPGPSRFWGGRTADLREEKIKERFEEGAKSEDQILWSIAHEGETVGFTGLFDIDWIARDAESGVFIGRADLYGRGIASEAVRLRTDFAWSELRLHRVHNWIALGNRGSRRANEKAGYRQIGLMKNVWFRSGEWHHGWLGEAFPPEAPALDGADTISPLRDAE